MFVDLEDFLLECIVNTHITIPVIIIRLMTPLIVPPIISPSDAVLVLVMVVAIVVSGRKNSDGYTCIVGFELSIYNSCLNLS